MNKEFIERIYDTIITENMTIYKDLFENTEIQDNTIEYWKNAIRFHEHLDEPQKTVFFSILKQVSIDVISTLFGIIDGSTTISGEEMKITMKIDDEDTEKELQDAFLLHVEQREEQELLDKQAL